jgi:hypothetical protein
VREFESPLLRQDIFMAKRVRLIPSPDTPIVEVEKAPLTVSWGGPGHESEYIIGLPVITGILGHDADIPHHFELLLQNLLGDRFDVMNRGSRLEAFPLGGNPDHEAVLKAACVLVEAAQSFADGSEEFALRMREIRDAEDKAYQDPDFNTRIR